MGTIIQMAAVSTGGTESALAQIDVPMNGNIIGVDWTGYTDFDTTGDFQLWQLSFGSAFTSANDSRQVIANATVGFLRIGAAGIMLGVLNHFVILPSVPVGMGERLYIHSSALAGVVGTVRVALQFDFDLDKVQVRRR